MSESKGILGGMKWVVILFAVWIIFPLVVVIGAISTGSYTVTEYFVEYGDSFSALLTGFTILILFLQMSQSDKDRKQTLKELKKDRKFTIEMQQKEMKLSRIK